VAGEAQLSVITADGRDVWLMTMTPGLFFGELSILSDRPEPATVATTTGAIVLEISDATLRRLMAESDAFREHLATLHARSEVNLLVRRAELFRPLSHDAFSVLVARHQVRVFQRGDPIAQEGEPGTTFYFVMHGFVRVSRRGVDGSDRVVTYYR